MDLIKLVLLIVVIGFGIGWLVKYFQPPEPIGKVVIAATVIILILVFLAGIGVTIPNVLHR